MKDSPYTLRACSPDDLPAFTELLSAILADGTGMARLPNEMPDDLDSRMGTSGNIVWGAFAGNLMVGEANLKPLPLVQTSHVALLGMAVHPAHRGQGLGSKLLGAVLDQAEGHSTIERVWLEVRADNAAALKLYQRFRFVEEGRRQQGIKLSDTEYADTIQMARAL